STDVTSGSRFPGPVSAAHRSPGDIRPIRVITGPSRATQMTAAPRMENPEEMERTRAPRPPVPFPRKRDGPERELSPSRATPEEAACGLGAQLTEDSGGRGALVADERGRDQLEPSGLVLRQAGRRQRVRDERGPGRGRRADLGDVDDLGRSALGHAVFELNGRR